jgi:murein DD-endopeptidase MepM/ murein hydrolase activator NlpD
MNKILLGAAASILLAVLVSDGTTHSSPDLRPGEFWRLPWKAGTSRDVSPGNGYGENTHHTSNRWALDFQVPEGEYVMAAQEGTVEDVGSETQCGSQYGFGTYVTIRDPNGFLHTYAHLQARFWTTDDYVLAGWAVGRAGHTGYVQPCTPVPGSHLHYRVTGCDGDADPCIPEPLSNQCADWSYIPHPVSCDAQGDQYAFSYDPSYDNPSWKDVGHFSNNAGVGDYPVSEFQPIQSDQAIVARYFDEGSYHGDYSALVVGKPINPYGAGWYVHEWDALYFHGVLQDFDSPDPAFGSGALMHGDAVDHDPADNRANIDAMWVFGEFWQNYISTCVGWGGGPPVQYFYLLGYPTTEQYEFNAFGYHWWYQKFQNGTIFKNTSDFKVYLRDPAGNRFGPECDDPDPPPPTPTRTRTPTTVPTSTKTPTPTKTFTPTSTPSPTPCSPDTDGDTVCDPADNCPAVANADQANSDARIGNGKGLAGDDGTVPNADGLGDACDADDDNDSLPDGVDPYPRDDVTYDDDNDGGPGVGCLDGNDASDSGPSWDANCNGVRDGVACSGSTSLDNDGDGLKERWELCKWGTSDSDQDSDDGGVGDCDEVTDVNGDGTSDHLGDNLAYAQAVLLSGAEYGKDGDFDINGDDILNYLEDVLSAVSLILLQPGAGGCVP